MPVRSYALRLMDGDSDDGSSIRMDPEKLLDYLKAWRKSHTSAETCFHCEQPLDFEKEEGGVAFVVCCNRFYYDSSRTRYPVHSIMVPTPGYEFMLPQLKKVLSQEQQQQQHFVVVPDPIYWQLRSTLVIEKIMKFVLGRPMTHRTTLVQDPSKSHIYYRQLQETPLNYGSIAQRSCGKATLLRQIACGKRCKLSMRFMIVPDSSLRPDQVALPDKVVDAFRLENQWIVLNRMPSLQPENFMALRVRRGGDMYCIGIPLEIVESLNADFDGDECNVYVLRDLQSQAECQEILNAERCMGSLTTGLVLSPSQDALVAYRLYYNEIDFLPYKEPDLKKTLRVVYELYGSERTFECFDRMRRFYREKLHRDRVFGITLKELERTLLPLAKHARKVEDFERLVRRRGATKEEGCLVTQIESGSKGSYDVLYQMLGSVGDVGVTSSFVEGLTPSEAVKHDVVATKALERGTMIWRPGYNYSKTVFNIQAVTVDNLGRVTDGERVVENDVLNALHPTDFVSDETFRYLMQEEMMELSQKRTTTREEDFKRVKTTHSTREEASPSPQREEITTSLKRNMEEQSAGGIKRHKNGFGRMWDDWNFVDLLRRRGRF